MDAAASDTLQALLLALSNPKLSLSDSEKDKLFEVGEQLELDPDDWDFISEGLMAIITNNPTLNQIFEAELAQLAAVPNNTKLQLLPTKNELAQIFSNESNIEKRGYVEGEPDRESQEILNLARKVLKDKDPATKTRQLNWIDRIKNFLSQSSNPNDPNT